MKNADLDSTMDILDTLDARDRGKDPGPGNPSNARSKSPIGTVEGFYDKISVAAIRLTGSLKVGDIIEIGTEDDAVRQRVSSMQINREDVEEAREGDSVGIKTKHRVEEGLNVYRIDV